MLRSLHLKLMLIMLLLITSLMTVVGAFLMTNVTSFYTDAFYSQMKAVFDESNTGFVQSLRMEAAGDDGPGTTFRITLPICQDVQEAPHDETN